MNAHIKLSNFLKVNFLTFALGASLVSCTEDYPELNTDTSKLTTLGKTELPFLFSKAQSASSYTSANYQVAQNLFADMYCQYFANTTTYFNSDRNVMRMDWLPSHFNTIYAETVPQLKSVLEQTDATSSENALASIWWVYSFHRVTDYYGPIPYFNAGNAAKNVSYDAQDKIYDDFFKRLDAAVKVLANKKAESPFGPSDLIYSGNVDKWIKFANSLRLRLAIRISKVDPARAKTEAEAAVSGGVITDNSYNALLSKSVNGGDFNGLAIISEWNEFRMSASMESVLKGYDDPRMAVYYQPSVKTKTFEGLRNGLTPEQINNDLNNFDNNSNVGTRWSINNQGQYDTPQNIISAAEVFFLRAEGALNGWNMQGTAKSLYEMGIETSLKQWGVNNIADIAKYISSESTPVSPNDFLKSPALTNIPVKWSETVSIQREQIGTQKWLALFPDGLEAWAEFRRSKYPKLYPVVNNENPDISAGQYIRRIPFLDNEKASNAEGVKTGQSLLGGSDKVTTPLWWDKN